MSRRLYSNHKYVRSGLITGTMWDAMMKYMQDNGVNVTGGNADSAKWGNYDDVELTNLSGYYTNVAAKTQNGKTTGETDGFKSSKELTTDSGTGTYAILTTGATEQVKKMNLYDVAGNLWEWTEEAAYLKNVTYGTNSAYNTYVVRGGSFDYASATYPACYRAYDYAPDTYTNLGFRLALYLQ